MSAGGVDCAHYLGFCINRTNKVIGSADTREDRSSRERKALDIGETSAYSLL
jgi:hypothetical protein